MREKNMINAKTKQIGTKIIPLVSYLMVCFTQQNYESIVFFRFLSYIVPKHTDLASLLFFFFLIFIIEISKITNENQIKRNETIYFSISMFEHFIVKKT